jgi:hypothetical protein
MRTQVNVLIKKTEAVPGDGVGPIKRLPEFLIVDVQAFNFRQPGIQRLMSSETTVALYRRCSASKPPPPSPDDAATSGQNLIPRKIARGREHQA